MEKKTKLLLVDVDGVLSAPKFGTHGVGMDENDWLTYCVALGDDAYAECGAVECVKDYVETAKADGAETCALTVAFSSFESDAKKKFVPKKYPGAFDGFVSVASKEMKLPIAAAMAKLRGLCADEVEIVEDDYGTLIEFAKAGMKATHVANVAANWSPRRASGAEAPKETKAAGVEPEAPAREPDDGKHEMPAFDACLVEKDVARGLSAAEAASMARALGGEEMCPLEIETGSRSSLVGFMSREAFERLSAGAESSRGSYEARMRAAAADLSVAEHDEHDADVTDFAMATDSFDLRDGKPIVTAIRLSNWLADDGKPDACFVEKGRGGGLSATEIDSLARTLGGKDFFPMKVDAGDGTLLVGFMSAEAYARIGRNFRCGTYYEPFASSALDAVERLHRLRGRGVSKTGETTGSLDLRDGAPPIVTVIRAGGASADTRPRAAETDGARPETRTPDACFVEKDGMKGLRAGEALSMAQALGDKEFYPAEIETKSESSLMGFVSREAFERLGCDVENGAYAERMRAAVEELWEDGVSDFGEATACFDPNDGAPPIVTVIRQFDWRADAYDGAPRVWVFRESEDDAAFGEEIVRTFLSRDDALGEMRSRFKKKYGIGEDVAWDDVPAALPFELTPDEVFGEDFVEIATSGVVMRWSVEEKKA